jgi:hypothetical protein
MSIAAELASGESATEPNISGTRVINNLEILLSSVSAPDPCMCPLPVSIDLARNRIAQDFHLAIL